MECGVSLPNETNFISNLKSEWSFSRKVLNVQIEKPFSAQATLLLTCLDSSNHLARNPKYVNAKNVTFSIATSADVEVGTSKIYHISSGAKSDVIEAKLTGSYTTGLSPGKILIKYRISTSLSRTQNDYIDINFTKPVFSTIGIMDSYACRTSRVDTGANLSTHTNLNATSAKVIRLYVYDSMYAGLEYVTSCSNNIAKNDATGGPNVVSVTSSRDNTNGQTAAYILNAYAVKSVDIEAKIKVSNMDPEALKITFVPSVIVAVGDLITIDFYSSASNESVNVFDSTHSTTTCTVTSSTINVTINSITDSSIILISPESYATTAIVRFTCSGGLKVKMASEHQS